MMNIAGVVFSLTLVALLLASSQFGPRVLRNFMRDTVNQLALGTFVATFVYSLLALRAIRSEPPDLFVPHLSVGESRAQPFGTRLPDNFEKGARRVCAPDDGYVQLVEAGQLLERANENDLILRLERRPGDYVVSGNPLFLAWPQTSVDDELAEQIVSQFVIGKQRTPVQDLGHAVDQLTEIALRALSPGVNDPFTAITILLPSGHQDSGLLCCPRMAA